MLIGDPTPKQERRQRKRQSTPYVPRRCSRCRGKGAAPCQSCGGSGVMILGCDLSGKPRLGRCSGCFGNKTRCCSACGGVGFA
jgi:hypothetical protein